MWLKVASPLSGTTTDTDSESSGQSAVVWVGTQVHIGLGDEKVQSCPLGINQLHFNGTLEVSEDLFHCIPVVHPWIFDEAAEDTDDIGNVGPGSNIEVK